LVVGVAKTEGVASHELDDAVDAFALGVAVPGVHECFDLRPPAVGGDGELPYLGDVGVRAPGEELPAGLADLVPADTGAGQSHQVAQVLLGDPRRLNRPEFGRDLRLWL
jgi:hypothetical protein